VGCSEEKDQTCAKACTKACAPPHTATGSLSYR